MTRTYNRNHAPGRLFRGLLRFITGLFRSIYRTSQYKIKRGYMHRKSVVAYDDSGMEDHFQKEVYEKAAALMNQHQWKSVIDIGCGSGFKLIKHFGNYKTLGVDFDPCYTNAIAAYPTADWLHASEFIPEHHVADIIICADVIEHVEHPDQFISSLIKIQNWKCLIISTPERNIRRGKFHFGPPPNPGHWREWSQKEFVNFISVYWPVSSYEIINPAQGTQMIICMDTLQ